MSTKTTGSDGYEWRERPRTAAPISPGVPDFGSFLRRVFPEEPVAPDAVLGTLATIGRSPSSLARRDYESAFTLLQRAADTFPALLRHCQQLESDLRRLHREAEADLDTAHAETQQWRQLAIAMKIHIDESDHQIEVLRKRLEAAEERLAAGQTIAKAAEQQASLAIGITTLFHDKIIDAFGAGSAAHATLDAVARGAIKTPGEDETR